VSAFFLQRNKSVERKRISGLSVGLQRVANVGFVSEGPFARIFSGWFHRPIAVSRNSQRGYVWPSFVQFI